MQQLYFIVLFEFNVNITNSQLQPITDVRTNYKGYYIKIDDHIGRLTINSAKNLDENFLIMKKFQHQSKTKWN